jgi:hypothetical protein
VALHIDSNWVQCDVRVSKLNMNGKSRSITAQALWANTKFVYSCAQLFF